AEEKFIGEEVVEFNGSSPSIETDIGTNGNIITSGNAHPVICGDERHGIGKEAEPTPICEGVKLEGNKTLPPITPPSNIATVNSNGGLSNTGGNGEVDTASKKNAVSWNPSTRSLRVDSSGTLTMGGRDYFLCKLELKAGTIYMPVESHVRIFIDTPKNC